MTLVPSSSRGSGGGSGTVTSVTAGDTSIVVGGTAADPTVVTASLAVIAADHASAGSITASSQKITSLANGSAATDALAVGQVLAANVIPVADLVAGSAGQVIGGTTPGYVYPPGFEINYTQITASVNITDTSESTATALISPGAITFDGTPVVAEFFTPDLVSPSVAGFVVVSLFEGATQIGRFCELSAGSTQANVPVLARFRFTPTAAAHTYKLTANANSVTGTPLIAAGSGGTAGFMPAYLRFTKV